MTTGTIRIGQADSARKNRPHVLLKHRGMTARERTVLLSLIWMACVAFVCSMTLADPDLWGHTLYGLRANAQGVLVERTDPFSYTAAGAQWTNHEWLTETQFGWLWQTCGGTGLSLWRNIMVLCIFICAGFAILRERASIGAALILLVFSAECLSDFVVFVRPQMATFALFAVSLLILRVHWDRPGGKAVWMLPPLMLVWTNLHGGFLAGIGLQAIFAGGFLLRSLRNREQLSDALRMIGIFALSCAATLVNPYGIALHAMLWNHLYLEQMVREWAPLWAAAQSPTYYVPFLLIAVAIPWSKRWSWIDLAVLAIVAFQAVSHIRHVALLAIATMILLPGPMTDSLRTLFHHITSQLSGQGYWRRRAAAVTAVLLILLGMPIRASWNMWEQGIRPWDVAAETRSDVPGVPLEALRFIDQAGLTGNLLTDYGWGQYALWHLHPRMHVAFDGRYRTVYPQTVERELIEFQLAARTMPKNIAMLDKYDTDVVLLPAGRESIGYLDHRADWVRVFVDDQAVIFVRDVPKHRDIILKSRDRRKTGPSVATWQRFPSGPQQHSNVAPLRNRQHVAANRGQKAR